LFVAQVFIPFARRGPSGKGLQKTRGSVAINKRLEVSMESRQNDDWSKLMATAREVHRRERAISLESVRLVGQLDHGNAATQLGISVETLARKIGVTRSVYCKRAQAARVIRSYPEVEIMLASGETEITCVAALATKITPANARILIEGARNKSKREVEQLLSIVTTDGRVLDREPEVEIRATLTRSQLAMLDRAREVLSNGGQVPTNAEVMVKALDDLLRRRDPLRKAERAKKRAAAQTRDARGTGDGCSPR
jgi:hypothetical protein